MAETIDKPHAAPAGYEEDFYLWTQTQAAALRRLASERANAPVDWENVAEEIESVGRSDRREVASLANHILAHLIKLSSSPAEAPRNGWRREVRAARQRLERVLDDSPSLRRLLPDLIEREWPRAVARAADDLETFGEAAAASTPLPPRSPPPVADLLDETFFPTPGQDLTR